MSRMGDAHQDLMSIHQILLGQRKVLRDQYKKTMEQNGLFKDELRFKVDCIDNLLLEFEAAGVVWPGNVVSLDVDPITPEMRAECCCDAFDKHGFCSCIKLDYRNSWPKEF